MPETLAQKIKAKYPGTYDDIPDAELEQRITATYPGVYDDLPRTDAKAAPAMNFATVNGQRVPVDDGPLDFIAGVAHNLNPIPAVAMVGKALIPEAAARAMGAPDANGMKPDDPNRANAAQTYGPFNAVRGILDAHNAVKAEADQAWAAGDTATAIRKYADWLIPVIGPALDQSADNMQAGKTWRGAGEAVGLGAAMALPKALETARIKVPAVAKNDNSVQAAAIAYGEQQGIPIDAATATGNPVVRNVQAATANTPLGARPAMRGAQAQAEALEQTGRKLADQARGAASTPETAGEGIVAALESKFDAYKQWADRAYDTLRRMSADKKNQTRVQVGTKEAWDGKTLDPNTGAPVITKQPVYESMAYPVDLRAAKAVLKPVYERMLKLYPVAQQEASAGFKALGNIVNGGDFLPLTEVDANLSAIKDILRGNGGEALSATKAQQLAGTEVRFLEAAVQKAATAGGPKVLRALTEGRDAIKLSKATEAVWDRTRTEPVQTYRMVTAKNDAGIDMLKTVAKETPTALPQIARAWIDQVLSKATSEGAFDRAKRIQNEWLELGPETKKILFPQKGQVQALDNYFRLARMIAENPNPSGSALTATSLGSVQGLFYAPTATVGANLVSGAISSILHNPRAVRLFTKGTTLMLGPGKTSQAARSMGIADLLAAAREAGLQGRTAPPVPAPEDPKGRQVR